jgi:inosine/xanthosine triphosphate pyrophosphatase family protein
LEEKNRISHRAQALQRASDCLEWLLAGQSCR